MNALEFIFGLIVVFAIFVGVIGVASIRYDSIRLEKENQDLKEKLRKRAIKETKKVKKEDK